MQVVAEQTRFDQEFELNKLNKELNNKIAVLLETV